MPGGCGGCGNPAKRLARAADGRAVRPHQKTPIAPTTARAPRMTVRFMVSFLWSVVTAAIELTILRTQIVPKIMRIPAMMRAARPAPWVSRAKLAGFARHCKNAIRNGSAVRIRAERRPSAVRVRTWRAMRWRSRMVAPPC